MSDLATAAAVLGSAIGVAKPIIETGCKLIEDLLGEPCQVAGGMLADQLYAWKWKNRIQIANRANEILEQERTARHVLPAGFLVPLLEAAGNTEDPTLQEMWARLLASGTSDDKNQHPAFVSYMQSLSLDEALIIQGLAGCTVPMDRKTGKPVIQFPKERLNAPDRLNFYFMRLHHVGILDYPLIPGRMYFPSDVPQLRLTSVGAAFVAAVLPKGEDNGDDASEKERGREDARQRFLEQARASTFRSTGPYPSRDELHERT